MNPSARPLTLRDDWLERRAFLASAEGNEIVDVQLRILDFLLRRYGDAPEAARPAEFPRPRAVYINQRAVLVHHHLGKHLASGIKSPREAQERMATILQRMAEPPADSSPTMDEFDFASLETEASSVAPFAGESRAVREARRLRFLLADPSAAVRLLAIFEIGETGDLDDIGLLMDLLALPENPDDARGEWQMLTTAIEKISGTRPRGEVIDGAPIIVQRSLTEQRASATDWSLLWGLFLASLLTMGLGMGIMIVAVLGTIRMGTSSYYGAAAVFVVYVCVVCIAWRLWERTRRRHKW